ncbi:MAG: MATE family efflux transporter [Acidobacteriota bacterium]
MDTLEDKNEPARRRAAVRQEIREVVKLATPVVIVQVGMMAMGVVDTMMLGRVSEHALAAGALGHVMSFGMMVFGMGFLMALDPLISQAFGADDQVRLGRHLQRGLVVAVILSAVLSVVMWDLRWLMHALGQDASIIDDTAAYIRAAVPGVVAFLLFTVLRQTLQAMSQTRQALVAIVVANAVNVVANYSLIFGHWGAPKMGVVGSGLATSLSRWTMALLIAWAGWPILGRYLKDLRRAIFHPTTYGPLVRLGIPIGFQVSLEMWLFTAVALLMGNLGARELAAHQIALNLAALSFMVPLGIAGAAATRVGNAIGRGDADGTRRSAGVCLGLGAGVMTFSAVIFAVFPTALARLYTSEMPVVMLAATLLPIAAVFQVVDGLQVVGAGVLRGAADTRIPAIIAFVGYWLLGLPVAYVFGIHLGYGPRGLWWGLTLGLAATAMLFLARIRVTLRGELSRYA